VGGIQKYVHQLCAYLSEARVVVVAPDHPDAPAFDAAQPFRIVRAIRVPGWKRLSFLLLCWQGLWTGLRDRFDVVVCGHLIVGPIAILLRRLRGVPYVTLAHAQEIRVHRRQRLARRVFRDAARVVGISDFTWDTLRSLGVPEDRIRKVTPGLDLQPIAEVGEGGEVRARLGLGDAPVLLTVARLAERYKGHDAVIRALPLIRAKVPRVRYVIAGDGPLRPFYARLAQSLGVEDAVVFTGTITGQDVAALYAAADVFIMASRESRIAGGAEGFGIVFLEASRMGKPVVGGRSGGIPDAVADGVTGLLVNPVDTREIADTVIGLLTDPGRARSLGENGRRMVLARFRPEQIAQEFRAVLAEVALIRRKA
jgi:phosphatidylinositol alpha-1,6-mannosyltransferase